MERKTQIFKSFVHLFTFLCVVCITSCTEKTSFVGCYSGTTVDNLGEDIGVFESSFVVDLKEDDTFIEKRTLMSDDGERLSEVTIKGEWGTARTEKFKSKRMTIDGTTIWFKYDLSSMTLLSEEFADELTPAYMAMFLIENNKLEEAQKEDKVYGWNNVALQGDSLINSRNFQLIAIKIPSK